MGHLVRDHLCDRRLVLFSHHPPFSHFAQPNSVAHDIVGGVLKDQKAFLWYWGHEHLLALYDRHAGWAMTGRCAQVHSGFRTRRPTWAICPPIHSWTVPRSGRLAAEPVEGRAGRAGATRSEPVHPPVPRRLRPQRLHGTARLDGATLIEDLRNPAGLVLASTVFSA